MIDNLSGFRTCLLHCFSVKCVVGNIESWFSGFIALPINIFLSVKRSLSLLLALLCLFLCLSTSNSTLSYIKSMELLCWSLSSSAESFSSPTSTTHTAGKDHGLTLSPIQSMNQSIYSSFLLSSLSHWVTLPLILTWILKSWGFQTNMLLAPSQPRIDLNMRHLHIPPKRL